METREMKILAIDDNQDNLTSVKALIQDVFPSAVVITALDGRTGIMLAQTRDPDVILLDIIMPGMDGFEVCRFLKEESVTSDIPVVFITAIKGDKDSRIRALECGAEAFLAKPIDESELTAQIRAMAKIKTANRANRDEKTHLALLVKDQIAELNETYTATLNLLDDLSRENEARKDSEKKLQESEQNYRTIVESGQALIWTSGIDGKCNYFNPIWCEFTGRTAEQEQGTGWTEGVHPDDLKRCIDTYVEAFEKREKFSMEYRLRHRDGEYRWIQDNGCPRFDSEGEFIGYIGHCLDIHERKAIESSLRYEQALMTALMDTIPSPIYFKDRDSRFIRINAQGAKVLGFTHIEDALGKTDFDVFTGEHARQAFNDEMEIIRTGQTLNKEEKETRAGASDVWVLTTKMPLKDKEGNITGTFGVSIDITERKINEEKINTLLAEKELILKEVHHRIKNNMNSIYGLLVLQAGTLQDQEAVGYLEEAANRVRSMMMLYSKLYQNLDFTEISVMQYLPFLIDDIMGNFVVTKGVTVEKHIEDFILNAKKLQPVGIIINELLTNIMKYAFSGRKEGKIIINVSLINETVSISISDNGNGMPESVSFAHSTGFGLVLVSGLTNQLNGHIRIERENGTRIILEFKR